MIVLLSPYAALCTENRSHLAAIIKFAELISVACASSNHSIGSWFCAPIRLQIPCDMTTAHPQPSSLECEDAIFPAFSAQALSANVVVERHTCGKNYACDCIPAQASFRFIAIPFLIESRSEKAFRFIVIPFPIGLRAQQHHHNIIA
eukprot:6190156-Pleurochrysis_carterae.AAC.1